MNSPQDPRKDPLTDDEVALGRVLRALPGGEPSPRVDAAILAAARDATAATPASARRRRGLPGWALGTAAAAVLAVGIGLQFEPGREARPEGLPTEAPASASAPAEEAVLERIKVTGSRLKREEDAEADRAVPQAKPAPGFQRQPSAAAASNEAPPPPPPAPPAPAAPPVETVPETAAAAAGAMADEARSRESSVLAEREQDESTRQQARAAPVASEPAPRREAADAADDTLPSAFSADEVLPPVEDDRQLPPGAWLERIRERIRQGDRAGARASLQNFERAHPDLAVPSDLAAFRP